MDQHRAELRNHSLPASLCPVHNCAGPSSFSEASFDACQVEVLFITTPGMQMATRLHSCRHVCLQHSCCFCHCADTLLHSYVQCPTRPALHNMKRPVQMDIGCASLPYQPYIFFVDEAGQVPSEGMWFDSEGGVTILVVLVADPGFYFTDDVYWAVLTDYEFQNQVANRGIGLSDFAAQVLSDDDSVRQELLEVSLDNSLCDLRESDEGFGNAGAALWWGTLQPAVLVSSTSSIRTEPASSCPLKQALSTICVDR